MIDREYYVDPQDYLPSELEAMEDEEKQMLAEQAAAEAKVVSEVQRYEPRVDQVAHMLHRALPESTAPSITSLVGRELETSTKAKVMLDASHEGEAA